MTVEEREELARVSAVLAAEQPADDDWPRRATEPLSEAADEAFRRLVALVRTSSLRAEALAAMRPLLLHPISARRVHALASAYLEDSLEDVRKSAILLFSLGGGTTDDLATMTRLIGEDPSADVRLWAAAAVAMQIQVDRLRLPLGKSAVIDDDELHRVLDVVERTLCDHEARPELRAAATGIVEALVDEVLGGDLEATRSVIARWREAHPPFDNGFEGD